MSNQFLRTQKREQEIKDKAMQEKIAKLLVYVNLAIIKYSRVLEVNLKFMPNGSILPIKGVKRAGKHELREAVKFLNQQGVKRESPKWTLFPAKDFLKEIEAKEQEIGVEIAPGVNYNVFGIIPTFAFREAKKKMDDLFPVEGAEPTPELQDSKEEDKRGVNDEV